MRVHLCFFGGICAVLACGGGGAATGDAGPDATAKVDGGDASPQNDSGSDSGSDAAGDGGVSLTSFPSTSVMYQDISGAAVDSQWATISQELSGGWGNNFQLDP
jgi:hypothetical protein